MIHYTMLKPFVNFVLFIKKYLLNSEHYERAPADSKHKRYFECGRTGSSNIESSTNPNFSQISIYIGLNLKQSFPALFMNAFM